MWLTFALLACGPTYEEGMAERGELNCRWLEACGTLASVGFTDVDACIDHALAQPYDVSHCSGYDAAAMQECIDGWSAAVEQVDCEAEVEVCSSVCS